MNSTMLSQVAEDLSSATIPQLHIQKVTDIQEIFWLVAQGPIQIFPPRSINDLKNKPQNPQPPSPVIL